MLGTVVGFVPIRIFLFYKHYCSLCSICIFSKVISHLYMKEPKHIFDTANQDITIFLIISCIDKFVSKKGLLHENPNILYMSVWLINLNAIFVYSFPSKHLLKKSIPNDALSCWLKVKNNIIIIRYKFWYFLVPYVLFQWEVLALQN